MSHTLSCFLDWPLLLCQRRARRLKWQIKYLKLMAQSVLNRQKKRAIETVEHHRKEEPELNSLYSELLSSMPIVNCPLRTGPRKMFSGRVIAADDRSSSVWVTNELANMCDCPVRREPEKAFSSLACPSIIG